MPGNLWVLVSVAPSLVSGSLDAAEIRQLIQEEVDKRVAPLQATTARLQEENARLMALVNQQRVAAAVSPFGGTGRQLSHDSSSASCCRWTTLRYDFTVVLYTTESRVHTT